MSVDNSSKRLSCRPSAWAGFGFGARSCANSPEALKKRQKQQQQQKKSKRYYRLHTRSACECMYLCVSCVCELFVCEFVSCVCVCSTTTLSPFRERFENVSSYLRVLPALEKFIDFFPLLALIHSHTHTHKYISWHYLLLSSQFLGASQASAPLEIFDLMSIHNCT